MPANWQNARVSRQIIVGDIALLRAAGEAIVATARGYRLQALLDEAGHVSKLAVQHRPEQTEEELRIFVACGVEVVDVIVEHEIWRDHWQFADPNRPRRLSSSTNQTCRSPLALRFNQWGTLAYVALHRSCGSGKSQTTVSRKGMLYQNWE